MAKSLVDAISSSRFYAYRIDPADSDTTCILRYVWNMALSEALYPTLQCLEIALRNGIHDAASAHFGTDLWYEDPRLITLPKTRQIIKRAKRTLRATKKPVEPNRVLAELQFGFWRHLFYAEYEQKLWRPIIRATFPNAPKARLARKGIGARVHRAYELRNRVFHHEPIWRQPDLLDAHAEILETISWISVAMAELARTGDRLEATYEMDLKALEPQLHAILTRHTAP